MTYGELQRLAHRVANGVENLGVPRGARLALYMPMTPESVAIYLGVILAGRCVVGIADASAPEEFGKRGRIADARAVFTIDSYVRGGKEHKVYEKVVAAGGPPAIVLSGGDQSVRASRKEDRTWREFLSDSTEFDAVPCRPEDATNILSSSGAGWRGGRWRASTGAGSGSSARPRSPRARRRCCISCISPGTSP